MSGDVPIVSLVGLSGVGKTTALEPIVRELKQRGYRVGTIKHHSHDFEVDKPGKDSWRHAQAGSDAVVISGPRKMALIRPLEAEMPVEEIVSLMGNVDIVITEGYKRGDRPKIEVSRLAHGSELQCRADELVAILTDHPIDMPVPQFALGDTNGVVNLIEERYLRDNREVVE